MELRMIRHGIAERIKGSDAYDAIHRLVALRRSTGMHRLIDPIIELEDTMWLHPSEKIEARRNAVRDAKAACCRAGIAKDVVDDIFPEPPLINTMPRASAWSRLSDYIGWRVALWRQRQLHAAHMEGAC